MAIRSQDYNEGLFDGLNGTAEREKVEAFMDGTASESAPEHVRDYWAGAYRGLQLREIDGESLEQTRLLGMPGQREAKHLAQIKHLEHELALVTSQRDALVAACQSGASGLLDCVAGLNLTKNNGLYVV
jgi:hypothetical protein